MSEESNTSETAVAWRYRLSDIDLDQAEIDSVTRVLQSRWLSCGPVTAQFESQFADMLGVLHVAAVSNCTAALHLALRCGGIGPGDEVIVPSLTFVATVNAVLYTGATPVFADIASAENPTISPADIRRKRSPRTRAVIVMHYGGYPCEMDAILEFAREAGVLVIEDAAHAVGGILDGRRLGTLGDIGCFSFFANKNLACGEGGAIVSNIGSFIDRARTMRSHSMTTATWDRDRGHAFSYDVTDLGYNYRMTELQAAIAIEQLKKLSANNAQRGRLVMQYRHRLNGESAMMIPFNGKGGELAFHLFPIVLSSTINREQFMMDLRKQGIQTSIHYPPVHLFSYYRQHLGTTPGMLPDTEHLAEHLVTLPLHPLLSLSDVDTICMAVSSSLYAQTRSNPVTTFTDYCGAL